MQTFDVIIIGGGPGGYLAAERIGHAGLTTLLIEKHKVGGVCLNEGCIPSKIFLNSAKIMDSAKEAHQFGVQIKVIEPSTLDIHFLVKRKNKIVSNLVAGVSAQLKKNNVTTIKNEARIIGKDQNGFIVEAGNESFSGKRLIVATGSRPIVPFAIKGVKENYEKGFVLTSSQIFDIEKIPSSLVVIGAGIIGLEMASFFNSVGTQVTVIEMQNSIAGEIDSKIGKIMQKSFEHSGIKFHLGSKLTEIKDQSVIWEKDGKSQELVTDKVLLAIGRRPNIDGFGLEKIGVQIEKNAIVTDSKMKTNIQNVYAIGDVNGLSMLAHTAYREAEVAVNNIFGKKDEMKYDSIPSVIFTHPEVASVGLTEESAKYKGFEIKVLELPLAYSGRYMAENEELNGICKLVVNLRKNTLIGAHIIGSYASEYIVLLSSLINLEVDIENIKKLVFPHPTVSEIIRETIWTL